MGLTLIATALALYMHALGKATWLEVGAFVTGALCVWLTVKESVWNFPISLVNVAVFLVVFINARLYADAGLQVVYFILSAVGWWMWIYGGKDLTELRISRVPVVEALIVSLLALLFTVGMTLYLRSIPGTVPLADAGTTAICLAAQWLLNHKRMENWWCWIVADVLYIPLYAYKELYLTSILYVVFLGMADPDCEIHLVPDELENDSAEWAKFTISYLGRAPDVVFTSEDYGPGFAEHLACRHVMVDRLRQTVPVSGTQVRREPLSHLGFLEPCVRAHFVRRVVLIGAESTGKTTLAALLAREFETPWVPEYGREYWEVKVAGLSMDGPLPGWSSDEFVTIAAEQQRREELAARSANKVLLCDTNAFATGLWHERYLQHRDERVDAIGRADKVALYLLCEPDFPFVQDGFRDGERIRDWMHGRFVEELAKTGVETLRLRGPVDDRLREARGALKALLEEPFDL